MKESRQNLSNWLQKLQLSHHPFRGWVGETCHACQISLTVTAMAKESGGKKNSFHLLNSRGGNSGLVECEKNVSLWKWNMSYWQEPNWQFQNSVFQILNFMVKVDVILHHLKMCAICWLKISLCLHEHNLTTTYHLLVSLIDVSMYFLFCTF